MSKRWSIITACALSLGVFACGSSRPESASAEDGGLPDGAQADASAGGDGAGGSGGGGEGGVSADAAAGDAAGSGGDAGSASDGSSGASCEAFGSACAFGAQCCSGVCDAASGTCGSSIATCTPSSAPCAGNTDCCSGACVAGTCGAAQCLSIGAACPVAGNVCCTGNCQNGACQPIVAGASCITAGNTCTSSASCCSGLCGSDGRCALASSYCIQTGDICVRANDCCGGICSAPNGKAVTADNPGTCSQPSSGGVNCTGVDGSLCPGGSCGSCCSRLCAPYGPSGIHICQPARGCRVEGDLCRTNADCCGATGSGVLGDGAVVCSNSVNGGDVGVCMTPGPTSEGGTCVPEGDVCHYTASDYTCSISSARSDCCGPQTPKFLACVLDPFGVPRCNAIDGTGDGGTCLSAGDACSMASECCDGHACVPDGTGKLTCSPSVCQQATQACTTNADCCAGLPCVAPPGSTQGTCAPVTPPPLPAPDGGSDAATPADGGPDAGSGGGNDGGPGGGGNDAAAAGDGGGGGGSTCAFFGQSCASLPCCPGTTCLGGTCNDLVQ